jgi:hypothetical protein
MALAAAIQPASAGPHRDVVTCARPGGGGAAYTATAAAPTAADTAAVQPGEPAAVQGMAAPLVAPPPRSDSSQPLTGELSRLHITVSRQFLEKLEAARSALSHARPGASVASILEAGLDLVLKQHAKRKGVVDKPRKKRPAKKERRRPEDRAEASERASAKELPSANELSSANESPGANETSAAKPDLLTAEVRREVWDRDQARCHGHSNPAESADPPGASSTITCCHAREEGPPPPTTSGSSAGCTTISRRGTPSATPG